MLDLGKQIRTFIRNEWDCPGEGTAVTRVVFSADKEREPELLRALSTSTITTAWRALWLHELRNCVR